MQNKHCREQSHLQPQSHSSALASEDPGTLRRIRGPRLRDVRHAAAPEDLLLPRGKQARVCHRGALQLRILLHFCEQEHNTHGLFSKTLRNFHHFKQLIRNTKFQVPS